MNLLSTREAALLGVVLGFGFMKRFVEMMYPVIAPFTFTIVIFVYAAVLSVAGWGFYLKVAAIDFAELIVKLPLGLNTEVGVFSFYQSSLQIVNVIERDWIARGVPLNIVGIYAEELYSDPYMVWTFYLVRLTANPLFWVAVNLVFGAIMYFVAIPFLSHLFERRGFFRGIPKIF
jgi:hypothetical protein